MQEDVYNQAGYGTRKIELGERPAVLVVDFQNAFLDKQFKTGNSPYIHQAAEETAELIEEARNSGIPIIYTVVAYRDNGWDLALWKTDIGWITPESHAAKVSEIVAPAAEEPVLTKRAPSAFFGTDLASLLNFKKIDTVIVTGCVTSGCIRATIIDSFSYGYRTVVPEQCVGDHTEEQQNSNLSDVKRRYAEVIPKQEVLDYVRSISPSIKS